MRAAPQSGEDTDHALPGDVEECLVELATGVRKYAMYPADHPTLEPLARRVMERVHHALADRGALALVVGRDRIRVAGGVTEARNDLLRGLARRLHEHKLLGVAFRGPPARDEIAGLLETLAVEPSLGSEPLGDAAPDELARWPNVRLHPLHYDPLDPDREQMDRDARDPLAAGFGPGDARFPTHIAGADLLRAAPPRVADLIEARLGEEIGDRVIAVELFRLASDMTRAEGGASGTLMRKMSELVMCLKPDSLGRLLDLGEFDGRSLQFLRDSSRWMAADAVVRLLRVAAAGRSDDVAPRLLRLVSKLARFVPEGPGSRRSEASSAIRDVVDRLVEEWETEDPSPRPYRSELERISRRPTSGVDGDDEAEEGEDARLVEPRRVVETGLELGEAGPVVLEAVAELIDGGGAGEFVELLDGVPEGSDVARILWRELARPGTVIQLLEQAEPELELLDRVLGEVGAEAAGPLLDALARSPSRRVRRLLFDRLTAMGSVVLPEVPDRLVDHRWYVVRNLLALIGAIGAWPDDFDVEPFLHHRDARVRVEAVRVALQHPGYREEVLDEALRDEEERLASLALSALADGCPPGVESRVIELLRDGGRSDALRAKAARALAAMGSERAFRAVADVCLVRRWIFWRRLAPPSPVVLAAVEELARRRPDTPPARAVLERAAASSEPALREAAQEAVGGAHSSR